MNKNTRKVVLTIIFILIFVCLIFSVSYGYYVINSDTNKQETTLGASLPSCAMVTMEEKKIINMTGDYAVPVKDERLFNSPSEILDNFKYSFTLTNSCDTDAEITLAIALTDQNDMPITAIKYLLSESGKELDKVGLFLAEEKLVPGDDFIFEIKELYGYEITSSLYKIGTVVVPAGTSVNYDTYFWIDYNEGDLTGNSNNTTMDKTFSGIVVTSKYNALGSHIAYCEENGITSFSECLIRSDSKKSLEEAKDIIDIRTATLDFNNLNITEPSFFYKVETKEIKNLTRGNKTFKYVEENLSPDSTINDLQNISFDSKTGIFKLYRNVKVGTINDLITTDEDRKNGIYKFTTGSPNDSDNKIYYVTNVTGTDKISGVQIYSTMTNITSSLPGLYKTVDKYTSNDDNYTYFYRGSVLNNWVKFGTETVWLGYQANGSGPPREYKTEELCKNSTSVYKYNCTAVEADIYWRIIRINGNGSIRMIYSGNNLDEKVNEITEQHVEGKYTGILTKTKDSGDSRGAVFANYDGPVPVATTYIGYMYNPDLVLTTTPNSPLKTPENPNGLMLNSFSSYFVGNSEWYIFDSFSDSECDTTNNTCTLTCKNYDTSLKKGDNCVFKKFEDVGVDSDIYTTDVSYGSTSNRFYYKGKYRYFCSSSNVFTSQTGDLSVTCTRVNEILGVSFSNGILDNDYVIVRQYSFQSKTEEEAHKNINDSNAKKEIDEWYKINFVNKLDEHNNHIYNYLSDEEYCNDRTIYSGNGYNSPTTYNARYRIYTNKRPSLLCSNIKDAFSVNVQNGNGDLLYPIGMITADEVSLAGNVYGLQNNNSYLSNSVSFLSMTPSHVVSTTVGNYMFRFGTTLTLSTFLDNATYLRPVINLSADVLYESGSGVRADPYTVKLN